MGAVPHQIISLYLFLSVLFILFICSFVMLRIHSTYMKYFLFLSLAVCVYAFGYLMEINSVSLEEMIFWNQVQYFGIPFSAALWYLVVQLYTHRIQQLKRWMVAGLFAVPVLTFFFRLTNAYHHWFYASMQAREVGGQFYLYLDKGPWYYVQSIYSFILMIALTMIFVGEYRQGNSNKRTRNLLLLASTLLPYLGLALILTDFLSWGLDYSILLLPPALLLILSAILRYDFMEVQSLARSEIFQNTTEALILLDMDFRIIDFNRSGRDFFRSHDIDLKQGLLKTIMGSQENLKQILTSSNKRIFEGAEDRIYEIRTRVIRDRKNNDLAMIKTITDISERVTLQEELEKLAAIDELSQLNNRRCFMALADREFARARRYNERFCILMMDIDRFKQVNDRRGHAAGDQVIRTIGSLMKSSFRSTDILGRLGGDEFVVLLPKCSMEQAFTAAESFRQKVENTAITIGSGFVRVQLSVGISSFHNDSVSLEHIVHQADDALYQAKASGRNLVSVSSVPSLGANQCG